MLETPEGELIERSKQGDQAAIAELFGRHYSSSLRLARGILRSMDASEDAVQVAYLSAFQHLQNFREDACFKTWITRIVLNSCLVQLREPRCRFAWVTVEATRGGRGPVLASSLPSPETMVWHKEMNSALSHAVSRLPGHLRDVYTLYLASGLPLKEVAATLGLTLPAAKTRLFRARAQMRLLLQPFLSNALPKRRAGFRARRA